MKRHEIITKFKIEIKVYKSVLSDKQTPKLGKLLLALAIGYMFLPFDLIPDYIPGLGQLDDLIIVPGLIFLALKLIPDEVINEHRKKYKQILPENKVF